MADSQNVSKDTTNCTEAVCVHTRKIYDSCRDKDCIEDIRVYPTERSQAYIDSAFSVRPRSARLLYADVDVDEVSFNRGYYTVDVTYYYLVTGDTFPGENTVRGLAVFSKRVMLFGSEGTARVFTSDGLAADAAQQPVAVVECVDPICLHMKLVDASAAGTPDTAQVPNAVLAQFDEPLVLTQAQRLLYTTLGQFSIIRLERDSQLVIPVYDYCFPDKECSGSSEDDPCSLFSRIRFPVEEFFPPDCIDRCEDYRSTVQSMAQQP